VSSIILAGFDSQGAYIDGLRLNQNKMNLTRFSSYGISFAQGNNDKGRMRPFTFINCEIRGNVHPKGPMLRINYADFTKGSITLRNLIVTQNYAESSEAVGIRLVGKRSYARGSGNPLYTGFGTTLHGEVQVINSTFSHNLGRNGACLYVENTHALIVNSTFSKNMAMIGGSVFINHTASQNSPLRCQVKNTVFQENVGFIFGATIFSRGKTNLSYDNATKFINNVEVVDSDRMYFDAKRISTDFVFLMEEETYREFVLKSSETGWYFPDCDQVDLVVPPVEAYVRTVMNYSLVRLRQMFIRGNLKSPVKVTSRVRNITPLFPLILRSFSNTKALEYEIFAVLAYKDGGFLKSLEHVEVTLSIGEMKSKKRERFPLTHEARATSSDAHLMNNQPDISENVIDLSSFRIFAGLNETHQLTIVADRDGEILARNTFLVRIRPCRSGERKFAHNLHEECEACPAGRYTFRNHSDCFGCPENAVCKGGAKLQPIAGYSRWSNESSKMYRCRIPSHCLEEERCMPGYENPLCSVPIFRMNDTTWTYQDYHRRAECTKMSSIVKPFGLLALEIVMIVITVVTTSSTTRMILANAITQGSGKQIAGIVIKMLSTYAQIFEIALAAGVSIGKIKLEHTANANSFETITFALRCWLYPVFPENVDYYLVDLLSLVPLLILFCIGMYLVYAYAVRKSRVYRGWSYFVSCALVIFFRYLPLILGPAAMMLKCSEFIEGDGSEIKTHRRWSTYLAYSCDSQIHKQHIFISIIWIIVVGFGFQFIMFFSLWLKRFELDDIEWRLKFGFIYNDYKKPYYYWEFVKTFVKMVLVCLAIVDLDIKFRTILLMFIFTLYLQLIKKVRPYAEEELNTIDQEITYSFIMTAALLPALNTPSENIVETTLSWASVTCLAVINVYVILRLGTLLLCEYFRSIKEMIQSQLHLECLDRLLTIIEAFLEELNPVKEIMHQVQVEKFLSEALDRKNTGQKASLSSILEEELILRRDETISLPDQQNTQDQNKKL
jgi:hypothetical protein